MKVTSPFQDKRAVFFKVGSNIKLMEYLGM